jgi:16S rRNA (cytidine1402-2'-O)-methyltransferase
MNEILGDRNIALAKEITKVFEKVTRGPISEVLSLIRDENIRGEYTIVVEGLRDNER